MAISRGPRRAPAAARATSALASWRSGRAAARRRRRAWRTMRRSWQRPSSSAVTRAVPSAARRHRHRSLPAVWRLNDATGDDTRRCCPCCCSRRPAATASARAKKSMNARAPPVAPSSTSSTSPLLPRSALRPPQRWRTRTPSSGTCGRVPSEPVLVHHPVRLAPRRRLPAVEHHRPLHAHLHGPSCAWPPPPRVRGEPAKAATVRRSRRGR